MAIVKITIAVVLIAAIGAAVVAFLPMLGDVDRIAEQIDRAGPLGPILFVVIQALQVIAAPVPGQVTGLAAGYLFGPLWGTIYCTIGGTIGCTVVFVLSRKLGRPFVEAFVSRKALQRFDYLADSGGAIALFLIFLVPIFPDDIISYIAGLTRVPLHRLVLVALFGRLPGYILYAVAGERAAAADMTAVIVIAVATLVLLALFFWQRHRVEGWVRRLAHGRHPAETAAEPAGGRSAGPGE
ncbi:MAG: TVP38/TMEM64 family protein [Bauldia sp.]|nr:TVP38/TMEM64 family protein [Bauldia sp.]